MCKKQNKREFCDVKIQQSWQWATHLIYGDFMETANIPIFKAKNIDCVELHTVFLRYNTNTHMHSALIRLMGYQMFSPCMQ